MKRARPIVPPRRPLTGRDSLNTNGVTTFPLAGIDGAGFVAQLRECAQLWHSKNLAQLLAHGTDTMLKDARVRAAKAEWDALPTETRRAHAARIDLRTDEGMKLAFDPEYLAKKEWWIAMPGNAFFHKAVIYVKQGNVGMALGNMAGAWTAKGFGLWAHLVPDVGLTMVVSAMTQMLHFGLTPGHPEHFPHPIYKPPRGAALEVHHDQMAPRDLLRNLRTHVASADPTTVAWIREHGCQMLAQLHGGTGPGDGATFIIGPMTPRKLLICLEAYSAGDLGGDYAKWNEAPRGKVDLDWEKHLEGFNRVLHKSGCDSVGLMAAVPPDTSLREGASFGVCWPVGFPHGSFSNGRSEDPVAHVGSRISITLPITVRGSTQAPDARIPTRLRKMAILATGGHSASEYAEAEAWLSDDKAPYAEGPTHARPQRVVDLIRHPDANPHHHDSETGASVGPFSAICAKEETVTTYLATVAEIAGAP